ncbi:Crossover junction endonuclease MUS81 [Raphanus sativus]|nr:Crossover junction endonuclease MUS81 [Raphanus sativus]
MERTFVKAYRNVCDSKDPISTLKDLFHIKGFGKWMLTLMKGYFDMELQVPAKERKRYISQRNSAAYGLLITLHRGTQNVKDFMRKQDLIDATDASGLSHASIAYESQTCSHSLILNSNINVSLPLTILVDGLGQRKEKGNRSWPL